MEIVFLMYNSSRMIYQIAHNAENYVASWKIAIIESLIIVDLRYINNGYVFY